MSDDLLASYRKPGSKPAAAPRPEPERAPAIILPPPVRYRAYGLAPAGEKPFRLELRANDGVRIIRPYAAATEFVFLEDGTALWMQFPQGRIALMGSHLQPVIDAILAQRCAWLAELRESEDAPPGGEPLIRQLQAKAKT